MPEMSKKITPITGFKHWSNCKVCNAKGKNQQPLRDEADALRAAGWTYEDIHKWFRDKGVTLSLNSVSNHFRKHSAYIKKGVTPERRVTKRMIQVITKQDVEVEKALDKIVAIGDEMIENWWLDREGPRMKVTERLFMEAIKEKGKMAPRTAFDLEFEDMEKEAIEGEVVEDGE